MTKTLTLLITSTALTALIGLPAWSAMGPAAGPTLSVATAQQLQPDGDPVRLLLVDDDEGEEDDDDDDDEEDDDDDRGECGEDDDDGADSCGGAAANPAPAGSVAPPQNGLFGNGSAPKVQSN